MARAYYSASINEFVRSAPNSILGQLTRASEFAVEATQRDAWIQQINLLQPLLQRRSGAIHFEYSIPRMGSRIDVVLVIGAALFVLEFKVGEKKFQRHAVDQVVDYALDLKNFHETSHDPFIAPILIPTEAAPQQIQPEETIHNDKVLRPIKCAPQQLSEVLDTVLHFVHGDSINAVEWATGRYCPTPTIIEAAMALYRRHDVAEISRSEAGAKNLTDTTNAISKIIANAQQNHTKAICFVTGVPGAGKTLVGLNIATRHLDAKDNLYSVFLSGNAPLVAVLQEALARDKVERERREGKRVTKAAARSEVKAFVQIIHHFINACLNDPRPPVDHVALFDEAQRAWDLQQTSNFMKRKKGRPDFNQSEPEFLISCIDRHPDWGVVICLVGGGQEINTGEAGIGEWIAAINRSFPHWHIHISDLLTDSEYAAGTFLDSLRGRENVYYENDLHLSVSMRSFRAEHVSKFVKFLLDRNVEAARESLTSIKESYPIYITRDLSAAKRWLRSQARGTERYGLVASSSAERLRPHAINVKAPMDPIHYFLEGKDDTRSSYYLEDVATEFSIQGLELDWTCVTWDADFRYTPNGWNHHSFRGKTWQNIHTAERQSYLKNAYRVLLTRARQGMIIFVPPGDPNDHTRLPSFYNPTYTYLKSIGLHELPGLTQL